MIGVDLAVAEGQEQIDVHTAIQSHIAATGAGIEAAGTGTGRSSVTGSRLVYSERAERHGVGRYST